MRRFDPAIREWIYVVLYDTLIMLGAFDARAADHAYERMRFTWHWLRTIRKNAGPVYPDSPKYWFRWYCVVVPRDRYREITAATRHLVRWLIHRRGRMIAD